LAFLLGLAHSWQQPKNARLKKTRLPKPTQARSSHPTKGAHFGCHFIGIRRCFMGKADKEGDWKPKEEGEKEGGAFLPMNGQYNGMGGCQMGQQAKGEQQEEAGHNWT
jgi:hypothetical protein